MLFDPRLSDDIEHTEENGNKRIKLQNNEINKESFEDDHDKEKSVMDVSLCESKFVTFKNICITISRFTTFSYIRLVNEK